MLTNMRETRVQRRALLRLSRLGSTFFYRCPIVLMQMRTVSDERCVSRREANPFGSKIATCARCRAWGPSEMRLARGKVMVLSMSPVVAGKRRG
jgi:hypothetical protein